MKVPVAIKKL